MVRRIVGGFALLATFSLVAAQAQNRVVTEDMIRQAQQLQAGTQAAAIDPPAPRSSTSKPLTHTSGDRTRTVSDPETATAFEAQQPADTTNEADPANSVFGREIFSNRNLTFASSYNLPTPANYVIAGGDRLFIDFWGVAAGSYDVKVTPDGTISLANLGVIPVGGATIEQALQRIKSKLAGSIAGLADGSTKIQLTLGDIRSIKVNIIGEALTPGTYTLPSLATLFNALYQAGGVTDIGSLRDIELHRDGKKITSLDVYEYLLGGKHEVNMGLKDNDLIVVRPYENLVQISGNVKRPRIYELRKGETLQQLFDYSGGFMGKSYTDNVTVSRKTGRMYSIHTVGKEQYPSFVLTDGDSVSVGAVIDQFANRISIEGAVWRPGAYELPEGGMTLKGLIQKAEGIRGDALMSRAQIIRMKEDYTWDIVALDLGELLNGRVADIPLQREDQVRIPSINSLREGQVIEVQGEVITPSTLDYREGMTIEDAIVLSGGLRESASLARIEVARRIKDPKSTKTPDHIADIFEFNIREDLGLGEGASSFVLKPFDEVFIRRSPGYSHQRLVNISGEILFSGDYAMKTNNHRLSDLIEQAGGLTPEAYPEGAYLARRYTETQKYRKQALERLARRNERLLKDTLSAEEIGSMLDVYPVAVNLLAALEKPNGPDNITLQEGDRLVIPQLDNTVTISGNGIQFPNTVVYVKGAKLKDYIANAGGYAPRARKQPFVIYANGSSDVKRGLHRPRIEPGCEIVVLQKPERDGMSAAEVMSLSTSAVSMAAVVASLL